MHWTYTRFAPEDDLEQGDILAPTEDLRRVLDDVHPHFCDEKYLGFVVATQSCDLVRRRALPKAPYVSLAVVRSLKDVLPKLLAAVAPPVGPGLYRKSAKLDAKRFLSRLLNQNEQAAGLFYLHQDADIGLGDPSVVFLRVKVALRADHYATLTAARAGRLAAEFRGKFGWLLGNLYARAASPDWSDQPGGEKALESLIQEYLSEQIEGSGPHWVDDRTVDAARDKLPMLAEMTPTDALTELLRLEPPAPIESLVDAAVGEMGKVLDLDNATESRLRNRLRNNGVLRKLVK